MNNVKNPALPVEMLQRKLVLVPLHVRYSDLSGGGLNVGVHPLVWNASIGLRTHHGIRSEVISESRPEHESEVVAVGSG